MLPVHLPSSGRLREMASALATPRVPATISNSYRNVSSRGLAAIEDALMQDFFSNSPAGYCATEEGKSDLYAHLTDRLNTARKRIVPWLNDARPLKGATILEIGCGTGASTVALAEQAASVFAIDVNEQSLKVARKRCKVYGLDNVHFLVANGAEAHDVLAGQSFDFIIFYAALEHMTHEERMQAMSGTWNMLSKGAMWCLIETPNRLWYFDAHTSRLPFFDWLPDDLAFKYSQHSPRSVIRQQSQHAETAMLDFLRKGRGLSYHEFDLTIKDCRQLDVVSSFSVFERQRSLLRRLYWIVTGRRYESFLIKVGPRIHRGFFQPYLDLIIRKN